MSSSHSPGKIGAIVNPRAGGWRRLSQQVAPAVRAAAVARWLAPNAPDSVWIGVMDGPAQGAEFARRAVESGCETVVAVGGDGTLNDVVQGIKGAGLNARVGLIPMGTANVLSRILQIPRNAPSEAGAIVRNGHEEAIDLGRSGDRWFALVAGVGFDGAVTGAVNPKIKRHMGEWAYILAAAGQAFTFPPRTVSIRIDDQPARQFSAYLILIANGGQYGGRFKLGPEVRLNDGYLDVFVCLRRGHLARSLVSDAYAIARNRINATTGVRTFRARTVEIESDGPMPVEFDGDAVGQTPVRVEIVHHALRFIVPRHMPVGLGAAP